MKQIPTLPGTFLGLRRFFFRLRSVFLSSSESGNTSNVAAGLAGLLISKPERCSLLRPLDGNLDTAAEEFTGEFGGLSSFHDCLNHRRCKKRKRH